MGLRTFLADILFEDNIAARSKRLGINQDQLDDATAYANTHPNVYGSKFIKSLTDPYYNRKGKTKDGQPKGAQHADDDSKQTTISFGDGKTTCSRFNNKVPRNSDAYKEYGMLVGDIKRKVDSTAKMAKNSVSEVPKVPKVKPVPKVKDANNNPNIKNLIKKAK